jgi:hypothetical protein
MRVAGPSAHLVMVLGDLMLERHALLLQMESRGFELPLSLPQLAHMRVGRDLRIRRSPMPISRMWGSPVSPMRGTIVGTRTASLGGCLSVRVVSDLRHETITRGVVAPLARGRIGDCLRIAYEEFVDRFHDVVGHTHELIVRRWQTRVSHRMAPDNLHGVAQTMREH